MKIEQIDQKELQLLKTEALLIFNSSNGDIGKGDRIYKKNWGAWGGNLYAIKGVHPKTKEFLIAKNVLSKQDAIEFCEGKQEFQLFLAQIKQRDDEKYVLVNEQEVFRTLAGDGGRRPELMVKSGGRRA
jgi:hypothetical protein